MTSLISIRRVCRILSGVLQEVVPFHFSQKETPAFLASLLACTCASFAAAKTLNLLTHYALLATQWPVGEPKRTATSSQTRYLGDKKR